jgi:hypothetical protein
MVMDRSIVSIVLLLVLVLVLLMLRLLRLLRLVDCTTCLWDRIGFWNRNGCNESMHVFEELGKQLLELCASFRVGHQNLSLGERSSEVDVKHVAVLTTM